MEDPDLFVPDPITLDCSDISETSDPAAIIDAWLAEAYTTDNCDTDPELAHSFNGDLLDICAAADYVITVTWTANDACGNTTILSSTITVVADDVKIRTCSYPIRSRWIAAISARRLILLRSSTHGWPRLIRRTTAIRTLNWLTASTATCWTSAQLQIMSLR